MQPMSTIVRISCTSTTPRLWGNGISE